MRSLRFLIILMSFPIALSAQLNTERLLSIGRNALYFDDYVLSISYFNQVIKAKPYLAEPYFYRAVAKIQLEDYIGAEADLIEALERNPFMPMSYYARGFVRARQNKLDEAEADYTKALEYSPENHVFMIARLEIYERQKRYDEALSTVDFLLRRMPQVPDLMLEKGNLLIQCGDTTDALTLFNHFLQTDSTHAEIWGGRAFVHLLQNNYDSALNDYNKAIELHSVNVSHYINRGLLRYNRQDYRGALSDYDKALQMEPDNEQACFNRGLLRTSVGDYNNAVNDFDHIIERRADAYEAIYQRSLILQHLGKYREAITDFNTIIEQYPEFVPALYARAEAYNALGQRQAAYRDMQRAIRITEMQKHKKRNANAAPKTEAGTAETTSALQERARLFSASADEPTSNNNYNMENMRGAIQNRKVTTATEPNFVLSYYNNKQTNAQTAHYSFLLEQYNKTTQRLPLYIVNHEIALTDALIKFHFKTIDQLSKQIEEDDNGTLHMQRAIDYALVQDFDNAITDFTEAINRGIGALAYFERANIRYKQLEYNLNNKTGRTLQNSNSTNEQNQYDNYTFGLILCDYDKAIELAPDFAYAWYNRANLLVMLKDYDHAIATYNHAIELNGEFAEAYFNRGLTHIYTGNVQAGTADLSKAGELGLYNAYSLLKKMREN